MPLPVEGKTQAWFRPHSLGGILGVVAGVLVVFGVAIFGDSLSRPRSLALICGVILLPLALDIHVYLARLRGALRNTPTTPVSRAKRGYIKLFGRAEAAGQLLESPQTDTPCVWHRLEEAGGERGAVSSGSPFLLRDATGQCLVDVEGAQVYGRRAPRSALGHWINLEYVIQAGDPVHAIGDFGYVDAADAPRLRNVLMVKEARRSSRGKADDPWTRARDYEFADEVARDEGSPVVGQGSTIRVLRKPATDKPFLVITAEENAVERWFTWRLWVARLLLAAALALLTAAFVPWR